MVVRNKKDMWAICQNLSFHQECYIIPATISQYNRHFLGIIQVTKKEI